MTAAPAPVFGRQGMVVSGHPLATLAGWRILEHGGSAVDAAVAAATVLAVVLPQACTVGGDMFALIHLAAEGKTLGLNASGPAPAAATPDRFPDGLPDRGPNSIAVPGVVAGWQEAHRRAGRLPWAELFSDAIRYASEGIAVGRSLARAGAGYGSAVADDPGCREQFFAGGVPLVTGQPLRAQALAKTLQEIAGDGAEALYCGRAAALRSRRL